jgi:arsenate reductase (thioredoxin)
MATSVAERERDRRNLTDEIRDLPGGTQSVDHVHPEIVTVMEVIGIDLSENTSCDITVRELQASMYVITMSCSAQDVCPATWSGDNRDCGLDDPDGKSIKEVHKIETKSKIGLASSSTN